MRTLILLLTAFLFVNTAYSESVIDFIVRNNPELQELKAVNRNILNFLKIEATGKASYGHMAREGTTNIERIQSRNEIGITASIPLISPSEKAQRKIDEAMKEKTLRLAVIDLLINYRNKQKSISEENKILLNLYNELKWIEKRVEAGVDNQKDYNQKLISYLTERKKHEIEKEQVGLILEKILSHVSKEKREELKRLIDEDISESR